MDITKMRLLTEMEERRDILDDVLSDSPSESPEHRKPKFGHLSAKVWLKTGVKSLARRCRIVDDTEDGKTNLVQTLFNLINANLGTGILAMPYVIRLGGYWGILITVLVGVLGNYTGKNLVSLLYEDAEDGTRIRVRDSYVDIGEAFSPRFGRYIVHVTNCIEQFAHCVLLLIMPGTVAAHTFPKSGLSMSVWIGVLSIPIVPTIFFRKMNQITWTSILSVAIAVIISICVLVYSLTHRTHWDDDVMPRFNEHVTPISLGVVMVTYSSQAYLPAIERCMRDPEIFNPLTDFAYTLVTVFKIAIGVIVFMSFTDKSDQVMTLNLPHNLLGDLLNVAAMILSLSFYTVPMFTIFDILENQLQVKALEIIRDTDTKYCGESISPNLIFRFFVVTGIIFVAAAVPHFSLLMSFIGNSTGMILVLLFPSLFYVRLRWNSISNATVVVNGLIISLAILGGAMGVNSAARAFYTIYNEY